jgi:DUF4097 and DUF4098 domain-containing protein YvlB
MSARFVSARFVSALGSVLGVCLLACSQSAQAAEKRLDRTFTVESGGRLTIEADDADLRVEGTSGNQLVVHILLTGSEHYVDRFTLSAEQSGNDVAVIAKQRAGISLSFGGTLEAKVEVQVPSGYDIDVRTSDGDIKVAQLHGNARSKTSDGDIDVKGMTGDLDAKTSDGYIHLDDVTGRVVARSSDGEIVASGIRGDAQLRTSGGGIRATIDGQITAQTSDGDVTAELVGANRGVSLSSSGGDLTVRVPKDTTAELNASTGDGRIRTELPVTTTEAREHKLLGTINGGGKTIYAHASDGNITVLAAAPN